jgi:DNA-binding ferritin-like protein
VQILVALLAMRQQYHSAHWQAAGPSFKADHDLFAQLYATVSGEIDPLAEKITCIYGAELVNPVSLSGQQATTSAQFAAGGDAFASAMSAEDQLQGLIKQAVSTPGSVSIGLDNYLRGVADAHETHKYLLKQRMAGA